MSMISQATIPGRAHRLVHQNSHDFAVGGTLQAGAVFGLVLDGCGSKYRDVAQVTSAHNEVGAKLLGQFTAAYLTTHPPHSQPLELFLDQLYDACLAFLEALVALLPFATEASRTRFIASHLLCTLLGFIVTPETAAFFWCGDGYLCYNDTIIPLHSNNRPDYLAYRLLAGKQDDHTASNGLPTDAPAQPNGRFHTKLFTNAKEIEWLAVATDGWQEPQLRDVATPRATLALQRWLNVQARQRGCFEDDGAVAAWYATGPPPPAHVPTTDEKENHSQR